MSAHEPDPTITGPRDPEHHPGATLAFEPEYAAALTQRVVSTSGESVVVSSPLTGQPLASIPQSSEADVAEAFRRARRAQDAWARAPVAERAEVLLRFHDLVLDRQDEILDMIGWESGKARKHAFEELGHIALTARYYGRTSGRHLGTERRRAVPGADPPRRQPRPKGVVGIISPWNYPFTMALCDGLPALVAGNAVVIKPDAQTMLRPCWPPGSSRRQASRATCGRWSPAPVPSSVCAIVGSADYVCFTGSTATGRVIAEGRAPSG